VCQRWRQCLFLRLHFVTARGRWISEHFVSLHLRRAPTAALLAAFRDVACRCSRPPRFVCRQGFFAEVSTFSSASCRSVSILTELVAKPHQPERNTRRYRAGEDAPPRTHHGDIHDFQPKISNENGSPIRRPSNAEECIHNPTSRVFKPARYPNPDIDSKPEEHSYLSAPPYRRKWHRSIGWHH